MMRSKNMLNSIVLLNLVLLLGTVRIVQAEPAPEKLVANHKTKECATIFGGDECMDCLPPEGWEVLGWSYQVECPAGYTFTEVEEICTPFKNEFCCTEGHSGVQGDCEDLAINRVAQKCAFVEDIHACHLPSGWNAKPEDMPNYEWACPGNYDWTVNLECRDKSALDQGDTDSDSGWLPFRCGGFALGIFLLGPLFTVKIRRNQ